VDEKVSRGVFIPTPSNIGRFSQFFASGNLQ